MSFQVSATIYDERNQDRGIRIVLEEETIKNSKLTKEVVARTDDGLEVVKIFHSLGELWVNVILPNGTRWSISTGIKTCS